MSFILDMSVILPAFTAAYCSRPSRVGGIELFNGRIKSMLPLSSVRASKVESVFLGISDESATGTGNFLLFAS